MFKVRNCHFLLQIFFVLFFAQQGVLAQPQFRIRNITAEDGLSQGLVNCIIQDHKGFMWFGTQDGLNRYDGNTITIFKNNPVDSNSLAANDINCLFEDKDGILWVGTDGGLSTLNLHTGKITNFSEVNSFHKGNNNIHSIYQDNEGTIWVGTEFNCLCRYNSKTGKFTTYPLKLTDTSSSAFDYVSSISEGDRGTLWVGSFGGGIYSVDKKTGSYETYPQSIDMRSRLAFVNNVTSVCYQKEKNELLIGTWGSGIEAFNVSDKKFRSYHTPSTDTLHAKDPKMISAITKDRLGNIWIAGNKGEGLYRFEEEKEAYLSYKRIHHTNATDFNQDFCNCLYASADNILWVGTNNGVSYYLPEKKNFTVFKDTSNLGANVVMSIAREADGRLWIGTNGSGLRNYDEVSHTYSENENLNKAMNNKSVLSLCIDKKDNLWIGTWGSGVLEYNLLTEKIKRIDTINPALAKTTVTGLYEDHAGRIWIGTYDKGAFIYDEKTGTIERVTVNNGLSDNRVYSFYEDSKHNIWICTDGGGVNCYSPEGKITCIKKTSGNNSLTSNSVNCIYEDTQGNLWIGTGIGLNKYIVKEKRFVHYFTKEGLPNDYIYGILPDKEGNLWLSTNKGISKFNPNAPNESGSAFKNYDESNGLPADDFNQGAFFETADGRMFFGSVNGIVSFTPEKVIGNMHEPPVSITACELFGKEFVMDTLASEKKYLQLSWQKNTISFSFIGLDYEMPAKNKYKYILEGADAEWSLPSTRHWANYVQLPPGHYTFRVKACNNDGVWSPVGEAIYINIVPPFWKTTWFYISCIIIILLALFGFVKYRTDRIEKEKKQLEAKVEERTHELAQKNRDITSSIQYAKRIQQAILPPLEDIKQFLPQSFILYLPKDIVSGDFYWFGEQGNKLIMVAADCTGHGVPGALMSMIGHNLLNQIVLEKGITKPSTILNHLNTMVQTALKQGISNIDTTDGMDMALCCFDKDTNEIEYAGANRPLIIAGNGELQKIDPDKMPIGGSQIGLERSFKNHAHKLKPGETIYMFSDGYADQFGGDKGKKFMMRRFLETLQQIKDLPVNEQQKKLHEALLEWQGNNEQVDDVLVIGIRST
ncbi:MAG TPA: two-component regulator propeller domain-containing protein [Bacteroidia bacterium]|nr:two-component regulator propeller domain-containing protein [Bacteroidia bacterium]